MMILEEFLEKNYPDLKWSIVVPTGEEEDFSHLSWLDEGGPTVQEFNQWVSSEPDRLAAKVIEINKIDAKAARDAAIDANVTYDLVDWQVRTEDRERMNEIIDAAVRAGIEDQTRPWILADNSIRAETSIDDLRAVLDLRVFRMDGIFVQYQVWRAGTMSEPFAVL